MRLDKVVYVNVASFYRRLISYVVLEQGILQYNSGHRHSYSLYDVVSDYAGMLLFLGLREMISASQ